MTNTEDRKEQWKEALNCYENAIKIIEWPSQINIRKSDKLEIHLDYAKHDNERKLRLLGTGKWKNFK